MSRITVLLKTNEGGLWIIPQIRELQRRGHIVTVVIPAGDGRLRRALDEAAIPVVASSFDFSFSPSPSLVRELLRLRRLIRATSPHVLFYHLYASALAARCTSAGLPVRRVHMVAGPLYLDSPFIRLAERYLCRLDDHLIAGSEHTAQRYRRLGLPRTRMSISPYGVDTDEFYKSEDRREQLFGCPPSTFVAIMVAYVYAPKRTVHQGRGIKGHDVLLEAWKMFSANTDDCLLVLVGGGFGDDGQRHRQKLQKHYATGEGLNIVWLDSVADVRPLYSSADISVSPSLSDNHGAVLEASAMSLPSLVSDAGALHEAVTRDTGWVVRAGDAHHLASALSEANRHWRTGLLQPMGEAARQLSERRFSHDVVLPRIAESVEAGTQRVILAFTEQRAWLTDGVILGRKGLPIVSSLAARAPVRLAVRVAANPEAGPAGVALTPTSAAASLPLSAGDNLLGMVSAILSLAGSVVAEVRRADVVYADQPGIVGGLGLVAARLLHKPMVVNVVGDSNESVHPRVVPGATGHLAHAILPRVQRWACANATYVRYVTTSILQARYPPKRAKQTFAFSTASPLGPPRPRPFPRSRVSVVTVASLEQPYKGIAELIDSIEICRTQGRDVTLTVVGEGRLRRELAAHAERVTPGNVRFLGQLYGEALYQELERHDVFALSSWTEGLPRALVEAMADGLPAVATSVGGVPELVEPHRTAPPRDAAAFAARLTRLLSDEGEWSKTIDHNLARSAKVFSQGECLERFVSAIAGLVLPHEAAR
jgi:glycosyltransferase involved in cell wall biosynthesis